MFDLSLSELFLLQLFWVQKTFKILEQKIFEKVLVIELFEPEPVDDGVAAVAVDDARNFAHQVVIGCPNLTDDRQIIVDLWALKTSALDDERIVRDELFPLVDEQNS